MLKTEQNIVYMVQEFDRKLRSITIASCAPAPLWLLSPNISFYFYAIHLQPVEENSCYIMLKLR